MAEELLIDASAFESRVVLVKDGAVEELHIARSAGFSVTGNIYLGKVVRIVTGMQAAFVDIGLERSGFLHASDIVPGLVATANRVKGRKASIRDLLHDGQELLVQVERDPIGTKGPRLSTGLALASKYLVLLPRGDHVGLSQKIFDESERARLFNVLGPLAQNNAVGLIGRTLSEGVSLATLQEDFSHLLGLWTGLRETVANALAPCQIFQELPIQTRLVRDLVGHDTSAIVVNDRQIHQRLEVYLNRYAPAYADRLRFYDEAKPIFERHNIEQEILLALEPRVQLKSGGSLVIEQTEAMISIDVNTAGFLGSKSLEDTVYRTNLDAAAAIPRQLRLRNLGGIVVIDFIDMQEAAHREAVLATLREALDRDPAKTQVEGFSFLGLVQLSRKRTRESLAQLMCSDCEQCSGSGIVKNAETVCMEILRTISAEVVSAKAFQIADSGRYVVVAHSVVIDRLLEEEASAFRELASQLEHEVHLRVDSAYRRDQFDLTFVRQTAA